MIGVISDIHGNYPALSAVMNELKRKNCRKIICLGDVTGYYCMVNECINLLKKNNVECIKGNHDSYLLGEGICPRSNTVNKCIEYQKRIISKENLTWLKSNKNMITNNLFCAVHGGWNDFLDEYITDFDFKSKRIEKYNVNIFLSGHTHKQQIQKCGKRTYCNPGSVGQPRDYDAKAAYAIVDEPEVYLYRVEYDIDEMAKQMELAGFDEYYYGNLFSGCRIGEKYPAGAE